MTLPHLNERSKPAECDAHAITHFHCHSQEDAKPPPPQFGYMYAYVRACVLTCGRLIAGGKGDCPTSGPAECFPLGTLAGLTQPACTSDPHYKSLTTDFACMGYALARGYLYALNKGADMVAPCGLAWQLVRAVLQIPAECKALVDAQYSLPLNLTVPIPHAPAGAALPGFLLYRFVGAGKKRTIDKHPNVAGQYLNALTFYATLFGESPVGAAAPLNTGSPASGDRPVCV